MNNRPLVIFTKRLILTSIKEESRDELIALAENQDIKKTYMLPDFHNEEEKEKFFLRLKTVSENPDKFVYGIYLSTHLIGFINEVAKDGDTIEMGYFISPAYWNNGYASEALEECIKELFKIGYNHVKCAHFEENLASARVMQKCHMKLSGEVEIVEYRNKKYKCIYYQIDNGKLIN